MNSKLLIPSLAILLLGACSHNLTSAGSKKENTRFIASENSQEDQDQLEWLMNVNPKQISVSNIKVTENDLVLTAMLSDCVDDSFVQLRDRKNFLFDFFTGNEIVQRINVVQFKPSKDKGCNNTIEPRKMKFDLSAFGIIPGDKFIIYSDDKNFDLEIPAPEPLIGPNRTLLASEYVDGFGKISILASNNLSGTFIIQHNQNKCKSIKNSKYQECTMAHFNPQRMQTTTESDNMPAGGLKIININSTMKLSFSFRMDGKMIYFLDYVDPNSQKAYKIALNTKKWPRY